MLPDHSAYHHQITRKEAERRLEIHGGHSHLTRYSKNKKSYILSVYKKQKRPLEPIMEEYKILKSDSGRLNIEGSDIDFEDIYKLLKYYKNNSISPALGSIGHAYTEKQYMSQDKCIAM